MVTRLEGTADNYTLVFVKVGDGWRTTVPLDLTDNMYVIALTAYDDAGNSAFYGTLILTVDTVGIHAEIRKSPFYSLARESAVKAKTASPIYSSMTREGEYRCSTRPHSISARTRESA